MSTYLHLVNKKRESISRSYQKRVPSKSYDKKDLQWSNVPSASLLQIDSRGDKQYFLEIVWYWRLATGMYPRVHISSITSRECWCICFETFTIVEWFTIGPVLKSALFLQATWDRKSASVFREQQILWS